MMMARPLDVKEGDLICQMACRMKSVGVIFRESYVWGVVRADGLLLGRAFYHGFYVARGVIVICDVTSREQRMV